MIGLLARKIGMTQVNDANGAMVPVTVLKAGPVTVTRVLKRDKDGYDALQVGFEDVKEKHMNRAQISDFKKRKLTPKRVLREFRLDSNDKTEYKVGQELHVDLFQEGEFVDVQGRSIGKGFQGNIKRWNQSRGPETHGSNYHRRPGSAGASSFPSRTWPGHHMPGQLGNEKTTVQNLVIMKILKEDNAMLVKGAVPGANQGLLVVRKCLKRHDRVDLAHAQKSKAPVAKAAKKPAKKK